MKMKKFVTLMSLIAFAVCFIFPAGAVASQQVVQDHDVGWAMPTATIHSTTVMDNYLSDIFASASHRITPEFGIAAGKTKTIQITGIVPLQRYWEGGSTKASIREALGQVNGVRSYTCGDNSFTMRSLKFGKDIRRLRPKACN